jgi:hypothetical protein
MTQVVTPPPATKRVFRVRARSTEALWILVEAHSAEEAMKLAKNIDAGYFDADWGNTDWEIDGAELATDYDPHEVAPPEAYDSL